MGDFEKQLSDSAIPFPQRHYLALELEQDSHFAEIDLTDRDLKELSDVHITTIYKILRSSGSSKKLIDTAISFLPLLAVTTSFMEEKVINFIRDGGAGMLIILLVGAFLVLRELQNIFKLIVVKDHSKENLRLDTPSVILGCFALMFFGIGWSFLGIYISASASFAAQTSVPILMMGIKESLTPLILSSLLSAVVILSHYTTRRVLHIWHAPLVD